MPPLALELPPEPALLAVFVSAAALPPPVARFTQRCEAQLSDSPQSPLLSQEQPSVPGVQGLDLLEQPAVCNANRSHPSVMNDERKQAGWNMFR